MFDRLMFRPLMGWATAWSFDRLRLWLEEGITPDRAWRQFLTCVCARGALALIFAYHGFVPKLWRHDPDEIAMLRDAHVPAGWLTMAMNGFGIAEIAFAGMLLILWHRRWPVILCLPLMVAATLGVAWNSPHYLGAAFNPVTLNLCVCALAVIDLLQHRDVPSAARCRRQPPSPAEKS